ncbi:MAG: HlyD family efflux transporter periplasmic adaptor subunit [Alistipes sp.]|nr:HlyD family efflux transporter periplasmic adaptor subunit [Alistipes sp.]MBQ8778896.1 HlyD family efflux transporter periplasmic adaptor subunit [Alistipes sp.]MBR6631899.1 HlyD family efflux transporter periplasmic adaptor subunit [Alistipes sp.]
MKRIVNILAAIIAVSCSNESDYDAQGTFEATEVVISAEGTGRILNFDIVEGEAIEANSKVGDIDSLQLHLQREQLKAQQVALLSSRPDKEKQVASIRSQIAKQRAELQRVENMLRDGAATTKQRDDIKAQIDILEGQLSATLSTIDNNTSTINENAAALEAQIAALDDRITKCRISSAVGGTVLVKYAEEGEFTTVGKPLMKVANLEDIYLRAYFTSDQLSKVNLGDEVTVTANFGGDERYDYKGRVAWISAESEFTPKSIQTKDSRANLVYAVKIAVKNDGRLKIGLAGEVKL